MDQAALFRRDVVIRLEAGLHLRPISMIAKLAREFAADIRISKADRSADAKNVFDMLTLQAACGADLTIDATGSDAREAVDAIGDLFDSNFPEPEEFDSDGQPDQKPRRSPK